MFTVEQIKQAHSKVKTGADFPTYINDIRKLGVHSYETWVADGRTNYFGSNNFTAEATARYPSIDIANHCNGSQFKKELLAHQQGKSDFLTFCNQCAELGIEKWYVSIEDMTCTYYDKAGNKILVEKIPS